MRQKRLSLAGMICIIGCLFLIAGCSNQSKVAAQKKGHTPNQITITDSTGRKVTIPQPLKRVVILDSDAAEAIRILKVQDTVIGISDTVQKNPYLGIRGKALVGAWMAPNYEQIVALKPQVVISYSMTPGPDLIQKMQSTGIKVVCLNLYKPDTYDQDFQTLAKMYGKTSIAEQYLKWKSEKTALLEPAKGIGPEQKLSVFAMWSSYLAKGQWKTFAKGTSVNQGIQMAGGNNVAGQLDQYPQVSAEWILQQNPSAIVLGTSDEAQLGYTVKNNNNAQGLRNQAEGNPVLSKTPAGKNGRLLIINTKMLGGGQTYLGALYLAKWFYPDKFRDLQPEQVQKEYFEKWVGVPFKGIWAYPSV